MFFSSYICLRTIFHKITNLFCGDFVTWLGWTTVCRTPFSVCFWFCWVSRDLPFKIWCQKWDSSRLVHDAYYPLSDGYLIGLGQQMELKLWHLPLNPPSVSLTRCVFGFVIKDSTCPVGPQPSRPEAIWWTSAHSYGFQFLRAVLHFRKKITNANPRRVSYVQCLNWSQERMTD